MANQRTANTIRQALEETEFDTGRYAYDIDVGALPAVPNYTEDIREILSDGIVVHDTEEFETVREMCSTVSSMSRDVDPEAVTDALAVQCAARVPSERF